MDRRRFLSLLGALPFVGKLVPKAEPPKDTEPSEEVVLLCGSDGPRDNERGSGFHVVDLRRACGSCGEPRAHASGTGFLWCDACGALSRDPAFPAATIESAVPIRKERFSWFPGGLDDVKWMPLPDGPYRTQIRTPLPPMR